MAAPTYQTQGSLTSAERTSAAVPVPSGVAADDLIIVTAHFESDTAITVPGGFAQKYMREQNDAAGAYRNYVWWKRATGADSGTYDFTWGGAAIFCEFLAIRVSGCVINDDPFGADDVATIPAGNGTTYAPIGILCETETLAVAIFDNWTTADWTVPSGPHAWSERFDGGASGGLALSTATVTAGGGQYAYGVTTASGTRIAQICSLRAPSSVAFTAPTIVNISAETVVATGTALNVTWPLNVEARDIAICVLHAKNNVAWNVPTNWADIFTQQNNGATQRAAAMWIRAAGGESGTVNFSYAAAQTTVRAGFMYIIRNARPSNGPFDGAAVINADSSADDDIEWSDYDPSVAGDLICWLGYYSDDQTTPVTSISGTPTATLVYEFESATGTDLTTAVYSGLHAGSHAAVGARTAAMTSTVDGVSVGVVFGVQPPPGFPFRAAHPQAHLLVR